MSPDDPRHGTTAGWHAHSRAKKKDSSHEACQPCRDAIAAYETKRRGEILAGAGRRIVPALPTMRRLQALAAIGYDFSTISRELDQSHDWATKIASGRFKTVRTVTADRVAYLYQAWHETPRVPTTPREQHATSCALTMARRNKWAAPHQWLNIDDLDEKPDPGYQERRPARDEIDPVVVERILSGDMSLAHRATRAERCAVVARWPLSLAELERRTGWEPGRYTTRTADQGAAAA